MRGDHSRKATRIRLLDFKTPPMRAFHLTWVAFFLCFFGWFGIAPLTAIVRDELGLTKEQIGNTIIASVAITILARLAIGWLCDRYGPRRCYAAILVVGALPVMGIGLAHSYETFLLLRLAIGAIGASFVITQYHTSLMFAPNCVGTANATTAGWGNMGGGAAQVIMPLMFSAFVALGLSSAASWRVAMLVPGVAMMIAGVLYYRFTQDTPQGNFGAWGDVARSGVGVGPPMQIEGKEHVSAANRVPFLSVCRDGRVAALALMYAACFGVEITIHNMAALYFMDTFGAGLKSAGLIVGAFGLLAMFARPLGGFISDRVSLRMGLSGRTAILIAMLLGEGLLLVMLSHSTALASAALLLSVFGLFVHMSCGATYALIPFVNRQAVGTVAGIVGAGGNLGAVASGFLLRSEAISAPTALLILGMAVAATAAFGLAVRFSPQDEPAARGAARLADTGSLVAPTGAAEPA